jgi:hypothetical protein
MQTVKDLAAAVVEDLPPPNAQEGPRGRVVIQNADVPVHQENAGWNGVKQLPQQGLVAHLRDWDTHAGIFGRLRAASQRKFCNPAG